MKEFAHGEPSTDLLLINGEEAFGQVWAGVQVNLQEAQSYIHQVHSVNTGVV